MGNKTSKPTAVRRVATGLAVLGALVLSSGVALMVTATPANAAQKVPSCHSTESTSNPWRLITTSVNAFYQGHVLAQHTDDVYPSVTFVKSGKTTSSPRSSATPVGLHHERVQELRARGAGRRQAQRGRLQPTCDDEASYTATGDHVASFTESAEPAPGTSITVTAHAVEGFVFDGDSTTKDFALSFDAAPTNCDVVSPPAVCPENTDNAGQEIPEGQTAEEFCTDTVVVSPPGGGTVVVSPPKAHTPKAHTPKAATVTTPTVVHAGLSSVSTQDLRGEQGLALMVAGMVMLVAAGGLGLRLRGVASRI